MSRGKYRTRAEAVTARVEAIQAAETLAEKCRRLEAELNTERTERAAVESSMRDQLAEAHRQAREGTSVELEEALSALSEAGAKLDRFKDELRGQVFAILRKHEAKLPQAGWNDLQALLKSSIRGALGMGNRDERRTAQYAPGLERDAKNSSLGKKLFGYQPKPGDVR